MTRKKAEELQKLRETGKQNLKHWGELLQDLCGI